MTLVDRRCALGQNRFRHPGGRQPFWFDAIGQGLLAQHRYGPRKGRLRKIVSAARWGGDAGLLIAGKHGPFQPDVESGMVMSVFLLEQNSPANRPNRARAHPQGGPRIGTNGKRNQRGAASVYRYDRGEVWRSSLDITLPDATCFADAVTGEVTPVAQKRHAAACTSQPKASGLQSIAKSQNEQQVIL